MSTVLLCFISTDAGRMSLLGFDSVSVLKVDDLGKWHGMPRERERERERDSLGNVALQHNVVCVLGHSCVACLQAHGRGEKSCSQEGESTD